MAPMFQLVRSPICLVSTQSVATCAVNVSWKGCDQYNLLLPFSSLHLQLCHAEQSSSNTIQLFPQPLSCSQVRTLLQNAMVCCLQRVAWSCRIIQTACGFWGRFLAARATRSNWKYWKCCSVEEEKVVRFLYQQKLRWTQKTDLSRAQAQMPLQPLCANLDVICTDHHFHDMNLDPCYQLSSKILQKDPYHNSALLLHIACCVQKNKVEELFSLDHELVNRFPHSPTRLPSTILL